MLIGQDSRRTIWVEADGGVHILDQTRLPHTLATLPLRNLEEAWSAISNMSVRGAPLIGITAAYGLALGLLPDAGDDALSAVVERLADARPTAVNLRWALARVADAVRSLPIAQRAQAAFALACQMAEEDVAACRRIGEHGARLIEAAHARAGSAVNILTHCNAGWLAAVDWGTALAPIYVAQERGIPIHVWVDETRPRLQGAALTAFELGQQGVDHTIIVDNAGGHLMQHGRVDLCIVGADRITRAGDTANKVGTYLKALAAADNDVPFYVAAPASTIDWSITDGVRDIPIEERGGDEVTHVTGATYAGKVERVLIAAPGSAAANFGFDVTPARLITGIITERGVATASEDGLAALFSDHH